MNTTWQTVYEQLQEFLNECIKLWWKLYWSDDINAITIDSEWFIVYWEDWWCPLEMSYHDLFSVDSWIMEFVEREDNKNEFLLNVKVYNDWIDADMAIWWMSYDNKIRMLYHYFEMSSLTAEEKCKRFVSNAKLPTKSE